MDDPLNLITDLLREQHRIPDRKLLPSARILHDLGIDGDDVSDLLGNLQAQFGTDFSALDGCWTEFFNTEGASPASIVAGLLLMISSTAATVWIAVVYSLSKVAAGTLGIGIFFGVLFVFSRLFPGKSKRPVTIAGLADVVRAGAWPKNPSEVR
jgi:hypothetical protein